MVTTNISILSSHDSICISRYSTIQRITSRRVLQVLATLFLLSYTKMLHSVCKTLFFFSVITHLPNKHTTLVWSNANVPVFGIKFSILFTVCLIIFLILLMVNILLLFPRTLLHFKYTNRFKPTFDAYFDPYKAGQIFVLDRISA